MSVATCSFEDKYTCPESTVRVDCLPSLTVTNPCRGVSEDALVHRESNEIVLYLAMNRKASGSLEANIVEYKETEMQCLQNLHVVHQSLASDERASLAGLKDEAETSRLDALRSCC